MDFPHCRPGFRDIEHVPDMPHALVDIDVDIYAAGVHPGGELPGIVQQYLVGPHMDQDGRQPGEIAVQGRNIRVVQILVSRIEQRSFPQPLTRQKGVIPRLGVVGTAALSQIGPGGDEHQRARQRPAKVAELQGKGQGEPATRRIAAQRDIRFRIAFFQQIVERRQGILKRGGIGMLGSQTVLVGHHRNFGALGQAGDQGLVRRRGT